MQVNLVPSTEVLNGAKIEEEFILSLYLTFFQLVMSLLLPLHLDLDCKTTIRPPGSPAFQPQILRLLSLHNHISQFCMIEIERQIDIYRTNRTNR